MHGNFLGIYFSFILHLSCQTDSVSYDASEIVVIYWFGEETFLNISNVENYCAA